MSELVATTHESPGRSQPPATGEAELVSGIQRGDWACLAALMDLHGEGLMRYLLSLVLRRSQAEDVFQETWVRVMRHAGRCDPGRPFAPWLFRVARNLALDALRWQRRWRFLSLGDEREPTYPEPSVSSTVLEDLASSELARRLLVALPPKLREVVTLRFWGDCSYEEIAAITDIPIGTVKSRLNRAMAHLGRHHQKLEVRHATTLATSL